MLPGNQSGIFGFVLDLKKIIYWTRIRIQSRVSNHGIGGQHRHLWQQTPGKHTLEIADHAGGIDHKQNIVAQTPLNQIGHTFVGRKSTIQIGVHLLAGYGIREHLLYFLRCCSQWNDIARVLLEDVS